MANINGIAHLQLTVSWAPGYHSVLFEDPDGIRTEANFVPRKRHLDAAKP